VFAEIAFYKTNLTNNSIRSAKIAVAAAIFCKRRQQ
jgi:hypothetical protein